jgi:imidazole glycerol-phosphate synthase subunit HisH
VISIVDYPGAKTEGIVKELNRRGISYRLIESPDQIRETKGIILPDGDCSFAELMEGLEGSGLADRIRAWGRLGLPLFAYGLGMKSLFTSYEADGYYQGLHLFSGRVIPSPQLEDLLEHPSSLHLEDPHPLLQGDFKEQIILDSPDMVVADNNVDVLVSLDIYRKAAIVVTRAKMLGFWGDWEKNKSFAELLFRNFFMNIVKDAELYRDEKDYH